MNGSAEARGRSSVTLSVGLALFLVGTAWFAAAGAPLEFAPCDSELLHAFFALLVLGTVGICLMVRAAILNRQSRQSALLEACPLTQPGPQQPLAVASDRLRTVGVIYPVSEAKYIGAPRTSATRPMSGLSWVSVLVLQILLILFVLYMTVAPRPMPKGMEIRILRPGVAAYPSPGIQPLIVRVEPARLFVNGQPVATEGFDTLLRDELSRRPPDWPVYVQGDPDMQVGDVLAVIDTLRGLHASVVLLGRAEPARH